MSWSSSAPPPPGAAPAAPPAPSALSALIASMSQAELLIVGGALLLVALDLFLGILARGYFFSNLVWASAVAALLIAFAQRRAPASLPVPYRASMVVLGLAAAVVAVRGVVGDLSVFMRPPMGADAISVLGLFGLLVGAGAMGLGAWRLVQGRD